MPINFRGLGNVASATAQIQGILKLNGDLSGTADIPIVSGTVWSNPFAKHAVADGTSHPLSEVFGSLSSAQAAYPFVTSLTQQRDWASLQSCIYDLLGTTNPIGAVLPIDPKGALYTPGGKYFLGSDTISITNTQGFCWKTAGADVTKLIVSGSPSSVLDLNGIANGSFSPMTIMAVVGGATPDKGIFLHWATSPRPARSTSGNMFDGIVIRDLQCRVGWAIGTDNSDQVDGSKFSKCLVVGNWSAGNVSTYQSGWELGNGSFGNNTGHQFEQCEAANVRWPVNCNGSSFRWSKGQPAGCEIMFLVNNATDVIVARDFRIEGCKRLYKETGGTAGPSAVLAGILVQGGGIDADGVWIDRNSCGAFVLDAVELVSLAGGITPSIKLRAPGAFPASLQARAIRQKAAFGIGAGLAFDITGTGYAASILDYHELNSDNQVVAVRAPTFRTVTGQLITLSPQAANADTSGATLPQLETEVNEIKALLRTDGLLLP